MWWKRPALNVHAAIVEELRAVFGDHATGTASKRQLSELFDPIVYVVFQGGSIVYVGMSTRGLSRLNTHTHHVLRRLSGYCDIAWWTVATKNGAKQIELELIHKYQPINNGHNRVLERHRLMDIAVTGNPS